MNAIAGMVWLAPHWQRLGSHIEKDRVPQALLLAGREGVGKSQLATAFAWRLLCRNPAEYACGECPSCRLLAAGTHPDYFLITPEEPGKAIPVDAIRQLIANLSLKPQYSGRRVVVINPAHQMNTASANSLLKTLEEPDKHTTIILATDSPKSLLETILSRCQRVDIPLPERADALAWLAGQGLADLSQTLLSLSGGAPLRALALSQSGIIEQREAFFQAWRELVLQGGEPVALADKWSKFPCETLMDWMISWAMDMIRLRNMAACPYLENPDLARRLQPPALKIQLKELFNLLDRLLMARRTLSSQVNRVLLLEELLILWLRGQVNDPNQAFPA